MLQFKREHNASGVRFVRETQDMTDVRLLRAVSPVELDFIAVFEREK